MFVRTLVLAISLALASTGWHQRLPSKRARLDLPFRFIDDANLLVSDTCYDEESYERAQTRGDGKILDLFRGE